jgi:hypothetical protein
MTRYIGSPVVSSVKITIYEVRALLKFVKSSTSLYLLAIIATLFPVISGCVNTNASEKAIVLPCQDKTSKDLTTKKSIPKISLVIDGSLSMLGYVKPTNSRYIQTLALLDTILLSQPGGADYARLESERKPISRSGVVEAQKSGFYTGTSSLIAKAFEPSDKAVKKGKDIKETKDQLVAVVTDLQPDGGDVNLIGKQILDRYLKKSGYAVAIWGIKSEFEGKVYPPDNAAAFDYSTKGKDSDKGRPFYVLIAGPEAAISDLVKQVKSQGSSLLNKDSEFTLFSPSYSIDKVVYAKELKESPTGFSTPVTIKAQDGAIIEDRGQPVRFLEFDNRAQLQKIEFELDESIKGDLMSNLQIEPVIKLQSYDLDKQKFVDAPDTYAIKLEPKITKDRIALNLNLNPEQLKSGTYYLNADLQVTGINLPKNWEQWNDPTGKDGSKTQGLTNFVRSITTNVSAVNQNRKPAIARLCLAIQKN